MLRCVRSTAPTHFFTLIYSDASSIWPNKTGVEVNFRPPNFSHRISNLQEIHQNGAVIRSGEYWPERTLSALLAKRPVLSLSRITLENNEKIRPRLDRENAFARATGGEKGSDLEPSLGRKPLISIDV